MKVWLSLKNLFLMLLLLGVSLLLIADLLAADRASLLIPSPEKTAEGFVSAVAAHRYTGALG